MRWAAFSALAALLLTSAAFAPTGAQKPFPRVRAGLGNQPISGGGFVAGDRLVTRGAVVAWNVHFGTLTLYLLPRARVTCRTLRLATQKPGHLIQVYVTSKPRVSVGRPVPDPQVAFLTIYRTKPMHVAGLKQGAQLTFTRIDSYPGGVWHGMFSVPRRVYGDGQLYGYKGTFAAKWCQLRK